MEMVKLNVREKKLGQALQIADKNYKNHPGNCMMGLQYANMLRMNGRYADALNILSHLEMLPAERINGRER